MTLTFLFFRTENLVVTENPCVFVSFSSLCVGCFVSLCNYIWSLYFANSLISLYDLFSSKWRWFIFLFWLQCISIVHTLYLLFQSIGDSYSLFPSNGVRYSVIFLKYLSSYWVELAWKAHSLWIPALWSWRENNACQKVVNWY